MTQNYVILNIDIKTNLNNPGIINDLFFIDVNGNINSKQLYFNKYTLDEITEFTKELQHYFVDNKIKLKGKIIIVEENNDGPRLRMLELSNKKIMLNDELIVCYYRVQKEKQKKQPLTEEEKIRLVKEYYNINEKLPQKNEKYKGENIGLFWNNIVNHNKIYNEIVDGH